MSDVGLPEAVLGVIITMGSIGGATATVTGDITEIGRAVDAVRAAGDHLHFGVYLDGVAIRTPVLRSRLFDEEAGASVINTGIGWHEARVPTIVTSVPRAAFTSYAARLKEHVSLPVVATNRINMPDVAERVRQHIHRESVHYAGRDIKITASIGVATYPAPGLETPEDLFRAADAALYRAKGSGRNLVCS